MINKSRLNLQWFKRFGIFFIPITRIGWILLIGVLVWAIYLFTEIDRMQHSVSDSLIIFIFNLLIIGAVYSFIAYLTSRPSKG